MDFIIKAAAVSDYTPIDVSDEKIKKKDGDLSIKLKRTDDILMYLGENKKQNQVLCGFAMETQNLIDNAKAKLVKKNADIIVANCLKEEGAGFKGDTNKVTFLTKDNIEKKELMSKDEVSEILLDKLLEIKNKKTD